MKTASTWLAVLSIPILGVYFYQFSQRTLTIQDGTLVERWEGGELSVALGAVQKVEETEDYAFIYVSAVLAHTVPKARVPEAALTLFLDELRRLMADARLADKSGELR